MNYVGRTHQSSKVSSEGTSNQCFLNLSVARGSAYSNTIRKCFEVRPKGLMAFLDKIDEEQLSGTLSFVRALWSKVRTSC